MPFSNADLSLDAENLREAQRGALHAVAAHVAWSDTPAQVVLPTGVGKTVACLLPYLLGANRVLVVTPARIVKDQVAHEFATQTVAKAVGALPAEVEPPPVLRADRRRTNWEAAALCDAVVGTPQVLSHAYEGVAEIPAGLFDLAAGWGVPARRGRARPLEAGAMFCPGRLVHRHRSVPAADRAAT